MAKIGAVINSASGTLPEEEAEKRLKKIKRHLKDRIAPECLAIVPGDQVKQEVRRLKEEGIDVLVIGGGDGTVSTAAGFLGDTDISMAVLGLGTRNHFARDLGIPLEPEEAIRLLDRMHTKRIDMGEVNGHTFINNATLGLYPRMVQEREKRTEKQGWKKWQAQIAAVLIVIRKLPKMWLTVEDGQYRVTRLMPFLFVGNNEYEEIINSEISRPILDGGRLWLSMAYVTGIRSLLRMAWQLVFGGIKNTENLETRLVTSVTVYYRRKKIKVAIDGENHTLSTPLRFNIRKKSLRVVVP